MLHPRYDPYSCASRSLRWTGTQPGAAKAPACAGARISVTPTKAGVQGHRAPPVPAPLDSRLRGNDGNWDSPARHHNPYACERRSLRRTGTAPDIAKAPASAGARTSVTPAEAGVQGLRAPPMPAPLDSRLRGNDGDWGSPACHHNSYSYERRSLRRTGTAPDTAKAPAFAGARISVTPAKAGVQGHRAPPVPVPLDSRLRGNDGRGSDPC